MGDRGNTQRGNTLMDFSLDESLSKMNELLEVLRVQGARIGLKINVKKISH